MKGKVKIAIGSHGETSEIDGEIFGIVAITPCKLYSGDQGIGITHIETGLFMGTSVSISRRPQIDELVRLINKNAATFTGVKPGLVKKQKVLFKALWEKAGLGRFNV